MKKRSILALIIVCMLAFGAGIGTTAYYNSTIGSNNNTITAAEFNFDAWKDSLDFNESTKFSVNNMAPGQSANYPFVLNSSGTEVPVQVDITINREEDLFESIEGVESPLTLQLVEALPHGAGFNPIATLPATRSGDINYTFTIPKDEHGTFDYSVVCDWPWETTNVDDKDWSGLAGEIDITVTATQIPENIVYTHVWVEGPAAEVVLTSGEASHLDSVKVEFDVDNNLATLYHDEFINGQYTGAIHGRVADTNRLQIQVGSRWINIDFVPETIIAELGL